jgi:hypothetical protein
VKSEVAPLVSLSCGKEFLSCTAVLWDTGVVL